MTVTTLANQTPIIHEEKGAPAWKESMTVDSKQFFDLQRLHDEQEAFRRTWIIVGATASLADPGSFRVVKLFNHSILLTNADGDIRAFHNSCVHRCRRLVDEPQGNAKTLRCPYHGWTYGIDGRLAGVPNKDFIPDFDIENESLAEIRSGIWQGLIFVNIDGRAEPLEEFMAPLTPVVDGWYAPDALVSNEEHELFGNWKIQVGNFTEFYHLMHLHQQRRGTSIPQRSGYVLFKKHSMQVLPMESRKAWADSPPSDWQEWYQVERRKDIGFGFHLFIYPCTTVHINPFYGVVTYIQAVPHASSPTQSMLRVRRFRLADGNPPFEKMAAQVGQDIDNSEPHSAGLQTLLSQPQRLSLLECRVAHFHAALAEDIAKHIS